MPNPPAGWYPDPDPQSTLLRWWDGGQWTEHRTGATPPQVDTAAQAPIAPAPPAPGGKYKPTAKTFIIGAIFLLVALIGARSSGFSGFLIMLGLIAVSTGAYAYLRKRPSWAQFPSRKVAGMVAGIGVITLLTGSLISAPSNDAPIENIASTPLAAQKTPEALPSPSPTVDEDLAPMDPTVLEKVSFAPSVFASDSSVTASSALEVLETLAVKGRAAKTGYDRKAKFGTPWADVDKNGCDTRNDILQRDLTSITKSGPCKVLAGTLADRYSGTTIDFVRGNTTSPLVQIDHVVALSDAWQKGAQALTQEQRISFANDPLNLYAVGGVANSSKKDGDAATWLPKNKEFRCEYVARQISVKATYGLWVTQAEKDAMKKVLTGCAEQAAYSSVFAPAPPPPPAPEPVVEEVAPAPFVGPPAEPEPAPAPPPAPSNVYYKNCTAARAAGAAPVYRGDPGYGSHLDRDGDGVGCE